jgi:2-polyprenyl-6-hydroxyphenyl methylase / 3-demethylubiquinone-9 3-methyltransferase
MSTEAPQDEYFFATYADSWWDNDSQMNNLASFQPPRFAYFDRFVDSWEGKQVLDVGCAGGFTTEFIANRGAHVSGVDPSPNLIGAAERHAQQTGKEIDYRVGTGEKLPHADGTFDIVTCVDVLEHVVNPAQVISEIHRVLKPGGIFLWDTINRTVRSKVIMIWLAEDILKNVPKGAHEWKDFIKPKELRRYLADAGFTPLDQYRGITILGQRKNGTLRTRLSGDLSCIYMGASRRAR